MADETAGTAPSPWLQFQLHAELLDGIRDLGFAAPTPIQCHAVAAGIRDQLDVIGAAETGSGKTLAYGLPMLHNIMTHNMRHPVDDPAERPLQGLVICPTRELAMQVCDHLRAVARHTSIQIVPVVGGISQLKQERLLSRHPHIVVGTAGRLWDLIDNGEPYLQNLGALRALVLDEADRMVEVGHFRELSNILQQIMVAESMDAANCKRQTFLFSATLSTEKHTVLERRVLFRRKRRVIDLTPSRKLATGLEEARIECLREEREFYLYYFIARYGGPTLVFVNSVNAIRRLTSVLTELGVQVFKLHAGMQQRQRLKNLERFRESGGVLLCSDVAARGLDIPGVKHVVHFELPRTPDLYVHRSGRTARAASEGVSLVLVCPEERPFYSRIITQLSAGNDLVTFPIELLMMPAVRARVTLAQKLYKLTAKRERQDRQALWVERTAAELGLSDDEVPHPRKKVKPGRAAAAADEGSDSEMMAKRERLQREATVRALRTQLSAMLSEPLMPKGTLSRSFITQHTEKLQTLLHGEAAEPARDAKQEIRKRKKRK